MTAHTPEREGELVHRGFKVGDRVVSTSQTSGQHGTVTRVEVLPARFDDDGVQTMPAITCVYWTTDAGHHLMDWDSAAAHAGDVEGLKRSAPLPLVREDDGGPADPDGWAPGDRVEWTDRSKVATGTVYSIGLPELRPVCHILVEADERDEEGLRFAAVPRGRLRRVPADGAPATTPAPSTATTPSRFTVGEKVRVRADFDVSDLAGLVGTYTGVSGRDATGSFVDVDLPEFGPVGFLPAELEPVADDAVDVEPVVQAWPGDDPASLPSRAELLYPPRPTLVVVPPQAAHVVTVDDLPMVRRAELRGELEGEVAEAARGVLDDLREVAHLLAAALGHESGRLGRDDGREGRDAGRGAVAGLGLRERGLPGRRKARGLQFIEGQNGVVAIKRDLGLGGDGEEGGSTAAPRDCEHARQVGPVCRRLSRFRDEVEQVSEVLEALVLRREVDGVPVDVERSSHVDSSSVVPGAPTPGDDATVEVAGDTPGVDSSTRGVTEALGGAS